MWGSSSRSLPQPQAWVAPLGLCPWPRICGSSSRTLLRLGSLVLSVAVPDLGRPVAPLRSQFARSLTAPALLECRSRKSRNTWSNRQIWPWSAKWSREKANRVLPREHTGHSKHPLPTTQEKTPHMDITRWSTSKSDWLYLCSQRWRSSIQSAKTKWGADCGSDHELLIAKFRLKLKKVGKTNTPFRYDLNQIPYDYTVEVRSRFKGLDLIDRVPDEL